MSTFNVAVEIPDVLRDLGYSDAEIRRDVPALLVLKRFRERLISSGKTAHILGISRRDFFELAGREGVPLYDPTDEQLANECAAVERLGRAQP